MGRNDSKKAAHGLLGLWALVYAFAIIYCSVVVSPSGFNFVPMDISHAWDRFLKTSYFINGSDQRADWMANLMMLIPLGYLMTAVFDPRRGIVLRVGSSLLAMAVCVTFVLAVKFLQLFFPGRTVSLNYIMAQSFGSAIGIMAFWPLHSRLIAIRKTMDARTIITWLLTFYAFVYFIYVLLPLDFTLSAADLHDRLLVAMHDLRSWPGHGRSSAIRLLLVIANFLATIPLGVVLGLNARERPLVWYFAVSLIAMSAIVFLKIFVMGATPYLVAIGYTTAGMLLGVGLTKTIGPRGVRIARATLLRGVPVLVPLYVLAVLYVNGLLSLHWRTMAQALDAISDTRGLIPFWNWYIVTKAHAAESQSAHAIMFLPIGVMLSLRRRANPDDAMLAATLAFVFALLVEFGRWFRPGFYPDFYESLTAALAAWLAVKLMRLVWSALEDDTESCTGGATPPHAQNRPISAEAAARSPGGDTYPG
jgi:VanZ family protein